MFNLRPNVYRNPFFWVVLALTTIALFLGASLTYASARLNNLLSTQRVYQSYSHTLNDLLFNLTNAETGQRGYLITGSPAYLAPYQDAMPHVQKDIHALEVSPLSKRYAARVRQITTISKQKIIEQQLTIATLQDQGQAAAFAIVNTNAGNNDMTRLRALIGQITGLQNADVQSRITTTEHRTKIMQVVAPIAGLLDLGLIITIVYLTRRAVHKEQQLESLKEQFVALASHQLRTPATAVKQYLHLLLAGSFGTLKREQREVLGIIQESNERGIRITNDLLHVSRADNKEIHISASPVNVSQVLRDVVSHYQPAFKKSKQQTIVATLPARAVQARVDPFYVRLIFENLIENASKYSDAHKSIHASLEVRQHTIIFSVRDEGPGIARRDMPLLFKKFSRLDQASKQEGSGLGLYLVREAAQLHGGEAHVKSAPNKGSTFTVKIRQDL